MLRDKLGAVRQHLMVAVFCIVIWKPLCGGLKAIRFADSDEALQNIAIMEHTDGSKSVTSSFIDVSVACSPAECAKHSDAAIVRCVNGLKIF